MLNLKFIFDNFTSLKGSLEKRGVSEETILFLKQKLEERSATVTALNELRHTRNLLSQGPEKALEVKKIKVSIEELEGRLNALEQETGEVATKLPNLPAPDTPDNEKGNRIVDTTIFPHNLTHSLTHEDVIKRLSLTDEEKSVALSGSKFTVFKGLGSDLFHALQAFLLHQNKKAGYQMFDTPYMVKPKNLFHTGQLPKFTEDLYRVGEEEFFLIPTAEVSLVGLFQNKTLKEEELPLKITGYSPCFRAEAGSAGQESRPLIRLHQFHKVELVQLTSPDDSYLALKAMVEHVREILKLLRISHRVVELCYEELGFSAAKTFDIEVFFPVKKKWVEISSCSNCEDFQARRAKINFLDKNKDKKLVHTLNGSSLPLERLMAVICEYYYDEKSNSLQLPEPLKRFLII